MSREINILITVTIMVCGIIGLAECWRMPGTQVALSVCSGVAVGFGVGNIVRLLRE